MKIGVKLIVGFLVVTLLMGFVIGIFSITSINTIQKNNQIGKEITGHIDLLDRSLIQLLQLIETEKLDDYYSIKSSIENIIKEFDILHVKGKEYIHEFKGFETFEKDVEEFTKVSNGIIAVHKEKLVQNKEFIEKQALEKDLRYKMRSPLITLNDSELRGDIAFMEYYSKETIYQYKDQKHLDTWLESIERVKNRVEQLNLSQNQKNTLLQDIDLYKKIAQRIGEIVIEQKEVEANEILKVNRLRGIIDRLELGKKRIVSNIVLESESLVRNTIRALMVVSVIVTIIVIFIGFFISRSITKPIETLHHGTEHIEKGDLNFKVGTKAKDEIGQLGRSFDKMVLALKKYQKKLLESEEKRSKGLKKEVSKKTIELSHKVKDLNDTKTALINMMADLREAHKNLKELDKAKIDFMNIVSHELKTPLTAVSAHLDVLDGLRGNLTKQELSSLGAIKRNNNQLKMLIDNILEIARMESKRFELNKKKINLEKCIGNVTKELKILSDKKGIKLTTKIGRLPKIEADENRVKEILTNLISNAIKFTEKGSVIVEAKKQNNYVLVDVIDTGIGIPKDKMKNLFKKFYQVDSSLGRRYGGTGLGLSITKQLAKAHGGEMNVKSVPGKGSIFSFTLPIGGK